MIILDTNTGKTGYMTKILLMKDKEEREAKMRNVQVLQIIMMKCNNNNFANKNTVLFICI